MSCKAHATHSWPTTNELYLFNFMWAQCVLNEWMCGRVGGWLEIWRAIAIAWAKLYVMENNKRWNTEDTTFNGDFVWDWDHLGFIFSTTETLKCNNILLFSAMPWICGSGWIHGWFGFHAVLFLSFSLFYFLPVQSDGWSSVENRMHIPSTKF